MAPFHLLWRDSYRSSWSALIHRLVSDRLAFLTGPSRMIRSHLSTSFDVRGSSLSALTLDIQMQRSPPQYIPSLVVTRSEVALPAVARRGRKSSCLLHALFPIRPDAREKSELALRTVLSPLNFAPFCDGDTRDPAHDPLSAPPPALSRPFTFLHRLRATVCRQQCDGVRAAIAAAAAALRRPWREQAWIQPCQQALLL